MKSPQHKQEENSSSIIQRLLKNTKLTETTYNNKLKNAQERRLREFNPNEKEKK